MTDEPLRWTTIAGSLNRPYPVRLPMVLLVSLVPFYLWIADLARYGTPHAPETAWDRMIPVVPVSSLIYGALYLFLILLPIFVVRDEGQIRRTVFAYLSVWITAYVVFLVYPTYAPRGDEVAGDGFAAWGLRGLYGSDPPYNCFPSLHVAHSFVSALACYRVHRGVGVAASFCAALVGVSTLFTKQHYIADVIAGMAMAFAAYAIFLRRSEPSPLDRRVAPAVAVITFGVALAALAIAWVVYRVTGS